jgi:hypothetical protein
MADLRAMVNSISAYIDMHEKKKLTNKQSEIVYKAREVILKSLEIIESKEDLGKKKMKKIADRLDETFSDVINVFSEAKEPSPEILETISEKKLGEELPQKHKNRAEKVKSLKKPKVKKVKTDDLNKKVKDISDIEGMLEIIEEINQDQTNIEKKIELHSIGMVAIMEMIDKLNGNLDYLKDKIDKLEKNKK